MIAKTIPETGLEPYSEISPMMTIQLQLSVKMNSILRELSRRITNKAKETSLKLLILMTSKLTKK